MWYFVCSEHQTDGKRHHKCYCIWTWCASGFWHWRHFPWNTTSLESLFINWRLQRVFDMSQSSILLPTIEGNNYLKCEYWEKLSCTVNFDKINVKAWPWLQWTFWIGKKWPLFWLIQMQSNLMIMILAFCEFDKPTGTLNMSILNWILVKCYRWWKKRFRFIWHSR